MENYRLNIESVINILGSTEVSQVYKLKNHYHFLEKQLLPLSKCNPWNYDSLHRANGYQTRGRP